MLLHDAINSHEVSGSTSWKAFPKHTASTPYTSQLEVFLVLKVAIIFSKQRQLPCGQKSSSFLFSDLRIDEWWPEDYSLSYLARPWQQLFCWVYWKEKAMSTLLGAWDRMISSIIRPLKRVEAFDICLPMLLEDECKHLLKSNHLNIPEQLRTTTKTPRCT